MINALVAGTLVGAVVERTASSDKTFVTCKVRVADGDGENQFVSVVAFDANVKIALLALGDGDSVALSGAMTVGTYEARNGTSRISIKLVASALLTCYNLRQKREAVTQASSPKPEPVRTATAVKRRGLREVKALRGDSTAMPNDDLAF
ncbi:single-stranded DNA-binding protein [Burkholderia pseudomallei]|uniref:single-stranded DNA-binding protein n=1 Tax=Burkholderia pseudomallei TaxID=28450 RepID=UPI00050F1C1D|nr:single-stranded DNA-binding protein [Burkholderia pseudomallei]KGC58693.1 single-strand binding family protein [Burkholderia pseudomallei]